MANGHAEGDWKRRHPREDKGIHLEDAEGRTGCSRVRRDWRRCGLYSNFSPRTVMGTAS